MTDQHPITPPPELLQQWATEYWGNSGESIGQGEKYIATQAARWGADQELEACVEWLAQNCGRWELSSALRAARRPPAASAAGRGGGGMSQPLSPVEELQERYRSAADEYPDPDGLAAALRAAAATSAKELLSINDFPEHQKLWYRFGVDDFRRKLNAIATELENHQ